MLILSRKKDESIIIDGNIKVTIVDIEDGKIKIGIDAPKNVEIMRKELYDNIQEENTKAINKTLNMEQIKGLFRKRP